MKGVVAFAFEAWATAHHYWTFWPRIRIATFTLFAVGLALVASWIALWFLERRGGAVSRLVRSVGSARLVFGGTLMVMIVSAGGHLYSPDESTIYATAAGIVAHGRPAAYENEPYPLNHLVGVVGPNARPREDESWAYPKYGIVPALLLTPLYVVGKLVGPRPNLPQAAFPFGNLALPLVPLLFGPLVASATAAVLYRVARVLGYARRAALFTAGAYAFGSLAWPYSKTLFNMPIAALALLLALFAAIGARRTPLRAAAVSGACCGLAVATRYELALAVPLLFGTVAWRNPLGRNWAAFLGGLAAVVTPLVFALNWVRTGSPVDSGYGAEGLVPDSKPWYALFEMLMSPGCGLAIYAPLMLFGAVALCWCWQDTRRTAVVAGGVVVGAFLYYGSLSNPCGYAAWGPRYLVTVGPFLALPLASMARRVSPDNPFGWVALGGAFAWGAASNLLAVLIDFNRGWQDHWASGLSYLEITWLPYFSGITTHTRLLRGWLLDGTGGVDLYLWNLLGRAGPPITLGLAVAGVLCWACVWIAGTTRSDEAAKPIALDRW